MNGGTRRKVRTMAEMNAGTIYDWVADNPGYSVTIAPYPGAANETAVVVKVRKKGARDVSTSRVLYRSEFTRVPYGLLNFIRNEIERYIKETR